MDFCEWLEENLEGRITNEQYEQIIHMIRTLPLNEIDGEPVDEDCPIFSISAHYNANKLRSKRDLDLLLNIYKEFRKRGVSFNVLGYENDTLLHIAVLLGKHNFEVVKFLVESGVPLNEVSLDETALGDAIKEGRMDIAEYLINNGAAYTEEQYTLVNPCFYKEPSLDDDD